MLLLLDPSNFHLVVRSVTEELKSWDQEPGEYYRDNVKDQDQSLALLFDLLSDLQCTRLEKYENYTARAGEEGYRFRDLPMAELLLQKEVLLVSHFFLYYKFRPSQRYPS